MASIAFIEMTDPMGRPAYIRADSIEGTAQEPDTGVTRVFVSSGGFYRAKESQQEIISRVRDLQTIKDLEEQS